MCVRFKGSGASLTWMSSSPAESHQARAPSRSPKLCVMVASKKVRPPKKKAQTTQGAQESGEGKATRTRPQKDLLRFLYEARSAIKRLARFVRTRGSCLSQELCGSCLSQELCTKCDQPATRQYMCTGSACGELYPACDRCDLNQEVKKEAKQKSQDRQRKPSIFARGSCMDKHKNQKLWFLHTRIVLKLVEPAAPADEAAEAEATEEPMAEEAEATEELQLIVTTTTTTTTTNNNNNNNNDNIYNDDNHNDTHNNHHHYNHKYNNNNDK